MSLLPNHPKRVAARERLARARAARVRLPLTYPLPRCCWQRSENGWISQPWTEADILRSIQAGGWFEFDAGHKHEFATPQAAKFAREAQESLRQLRSQMEV